MIKILIADDHPAVRSALKCFLETEDGVEVVGDASNGTDAVIALEKLRPDILLSDVRMPGLNGLEVLNHIRAKCLPTKAILVTSIAEKACKEAAYRLGALGYVLKDDVAEDLIPAIFQAVRTN
ncbi:response regulator [Dehalogenimonas etheniformans]|uniref:DNA-binding response regulator n=1 Tax=Dehalogenimonas etheniformans TaxID=1536648 RepID=A0A2P5P6G8_9CHLR|nr:response regulator transcription factor [Dehalogenimonas etheniformans]PPD57893.1 DNA-binding response regulator [Dehalogenimonas etheniformans]QNT75455.1 response regulator transcription factor [Dehalogenimonas etheniformans]